LSSHRRFLYVFVFVVGCSTLGAEIAAARLMAPYFGASTIVWANTIGVVLVALSIGYWFGGRIADLYPHMRGLCAMAMAAAVLLAVVPFISQPLFDVAVDALDEISAGAFVGSLFAVLFLIAVPVILLGAVAPYAIRLSIPDVEHSGSIAGRLYAVSTAGSLLGTWLAALLLIPFVGTQRTFVIFAAAIAAVAAVGLSRRYAVVPVVLALAVAIPAGTLRASPEGEVLVERETEQQYVQVVEQEDGDRVLELNEGQAIHSLYRPGSYLTDRYWDGMMMLPFAAHSDPPERVAILGNAAGTTARMYGHYFPDTRVDGVEIDGEVTEIGREYFDLGAPNLVTHEADARPWLRRSDEEFDVIAIDAYRQPYIPFYLATREFFELAADRLAPGGAVVINVGHPEGNDDLERVIGATMATAFETVVRDPVADTNTLLLATQGEAAGERLLEATAGMPAELRAVAAEEAERIAPRLAGEEIYTDDRAPVEWLIDSSLLGYAGEE
jgi:spermidine synthase